MGWIEDIFEWLNNWNRYWIQKHKEWVEETFGSQEAYEAYVMQYEDGVNALYELAGYFVDNPDAIFDFMYEDLYEGYLEC